jgi:hypothetical protein
MVIACAVKLTAVAFASAIVTARLPGVNVKPLRAGVTVYDPFSSPLKL